MLVQIALLYLITFGGCSTHTINIAFEYQLNITNDYSMSLDIAEINDGRPSLWIIQPIVIDGQITFRNNDPSIEYYYNYANSIYFRKFSISPSAIFRYDFSKHNKDEIKSIKVISDDRDSTITGNYIIDYRYDYSRNFGIIMIIIIGVGMGLFCYLTIHIIGSGDSSSPPIYSLPVTPHPIKILHQ